MQLTFAGRVAEEVEKLRQRLCLPVQGRRYVFHRDLQITAGADLLEIPTPGMNLPIDAGRNA